MNNKDKIILDLCGGTESWSKPYRDAGYDVRVITLPDYDVRNFHNDGVRFTFPSMMITNKPRMEGKIKNVYGILAAPPCTQFSYARTNAKKDRDFKEAMSIVSACLNVIWEAQYKPVSRTAKRTTLEFWALENPYFGFLKHFIGNPNFTFDPYEFGDKYKKKTALWGHFNPPRKIVKYAPDNYRKFDKLFTKEIHPEKYGELTRTERRAITPVGFAKAFFEANP